MEDKLNDEIFEKIKGILSGGNGGNGILELDNSSLLYKICNGQASESEIEEWNKTMPIDENKIRESCDLGYNIASKLDQSKEYNNNELDDLRCEMIEMKKEIEELKIKYLNLSKK